MKTWELELKLENEIQAGDLLDQLKKAFQMASKLDEPMDLFEMSNPDSYLKCVLTEEDKS